MTNEIQLFNYGENAVRTIEKDGEIWFVAKDVCDILELSNPTEALKSLDEDERSKFLLGRQGEANIISEAGAYTLAIRSKKPEAKKFRRWITHEVIPQIIRTGEYSVNKDNRPAIIEGQEEFDPKLKYLSRGMFRTASQIYEAVFAMQNKEFDIMEAQKILALDKLFETVTGKSALEIAGIKIKIDCDDWHDEKRQGQWYRRNFRWVYRDIPRFRTLDFLPDDEAAFESIMEERKKEEY